MSSFQPRITGIPAAISVSREVLFGGYAPSRIYLTVGEIELRLPLNRPLRIGVSASEADIAVRHPGFRNRTIELTVVEENRVRISEAHVRRGVNAAGPAVKLNQSSGEGWEVNLAQADAAFFLDFDTARVMCFKLFKLREPIIGVVPVTALYRDPTRAAIDLVQGEAPQVIQWLREALVARAECRDLSARIHENIDRKRGWDRPAKVALGGGVGSSILSAAVGHVLIYFGITPIAYSALFTGFVVVSALGTVATLLSMILPAFRVRHFNKLNDALRLELDRVKEVLEERTKIIMTTLEQVPSGFKSQFIQRLDENLSDAYFQIKSGRFYHE